jgi:oligosaccharide reducing-end xylanase
MKLCILRHGDEAERGDPGCKETEHGRPFMKKAKYGGSTVRPESWWGERPREPETQRVTRPAARRESRPTKLFHCPKYRVLALAGLALALTACRVPMRQNTPTGGATDGTGAFVTGHYRNLFVEAGHSPRAVKTKIDAAFQQLFHGDSATQAVYYAAGTNAAGPLGYVTDIKHKDVRTEGMSYGMMIAVQLGRKAEFDAIWNWARTYMYNASPTHPSCGFFSWSLKTNGVRNSELVAPDGEEYFVTALYFAAHRWGNGAGIYNYAAEADRLLAAMRHREVITGPTPRGEVTAGPLFDEERKMVLFSPSAEVTRHTDPSYHLPAFYELWARWGPVADRSFWAEAAAASRDFLQRAANPATALTPDYAAFDGTPHFNPGRGTNSVHFRFDAWRTAMNWSVDWSWWARDVRERALSDRLQAFFESKGMASYGAQFRLDGTATDDHHMTGLVAVNAVAGLAATHSRAKEFVEALWNAPVPDGIERYYDGLLYLMALMHCGGEFRIWQ